MNCRMFGVAFERHACPVQKHEFRMVVLSTLVGLASAVAATLVADLAIRHAGLAWRGAVFGHEEFNWKDSRIFFLAAAAYAVGMVSTATIMRRRRRRDL